MSNITFTFVSNYINHHQKPFCDACYKLLGNGFTFVQTMPMEAERVAMGWSTELTSLPYVKLLYEDDSCKQLIMDSDCVLFGWSEREDIAQERLLSGKVTLRVSERLYRDGRYKAISPRGLYAKYHEHIRFRNKPVYMLCAGAYTASDFSLIKAYPDKCLKWGYFPPLRTYDWDELVQKKNATGKIELAWAGRFIPLKHPEFVINLARKIKEKNIPAHIHMVGAGEMESWIKEQVNDGLEGIISLYGFLPPEDVRDVMEKCHIHMCTSNQLEGWGAVVNEGMNSGCLEIVSDRMGAVPFLIKDGVSGITYSKDSYEEFEKKTLAAITNWNECELIAKRAYETIVNEWNADTAAKRLISLMEQLLNKKEITLPENGPVSLAPDLKLR